MICNTISRSRRRVFLILIAVCVSVASVWYFPKPTHWNSIHPGMTREHIHTIIGSPTYDSYDLKGLETWRSSRIVFVWRMRIIFNSGVARGVDISTDFGPW